MSHNNNTELVNTLLSLNTQAWNDLHSSAALTHVLQMGGVPLVNVLKLVHVIAHTTNRKFRNKYVNQFVDTLSHTNLSVDCNKLLGSVVKLLTAFNSKYSVPTVTADDVQVWTHDNSQDYIPYIVGDSKYWVSCLRSGVQYTLAKDNTYLVDWTTEEGVRNAMKLGHDNRGCNASYLEVEHSEFHAGKLMYLTIGKFCDEDPDGPRARARVYLCKYNQLDYAVIDRVYFTNEDEVRAIYAKLYSMYNGRVYTTVNSNLLKCGKEVPMYKFSIRSSLYTDYTDVMHVLEVLPRTASNVSVCYGRDTGMYIRIAGATEITYITKQSLRLPESRIYREVKYLCCSAHYVATDRLSVMHRLVTHAGYNIINSDAVNVSFRHNDSMLITPSALTWKARGCKYSVNSDLEFIRRDRSGSYSVYNLRTGKWEGSNFFTRSSCNNLTRHNVHLIYKFLPHGTNRVH